MKTGAIRNTGFRKTSGILPKGKNTLGVVKSSKEIQRLIDDQIASIKVIYTKL